MNRREALQAIEQRLPRDSAVASSPDHPNLLDGPDLLVGRFGHLMAVLAPKSSEIASPALFISRAVLSRIVLPANAMLVLALDSKDVWSNAFASRVARSVHDVVDVSSPRELSAIVSSGLQRDSGLGFPTRVRQMIYERAGYLLRLSQVVTLRTRKSEAERTPARVAFSQLREVSPAAAWRNQLRLEPSISPRLLRVADTIIDRSNVLVGYVERDRTRSPKDVLAPYFAISTTLNYSLDNGVPEPIRPLASLLLAEVLPTYRTDHYKPLRAAAFAGCAILEDPIPDRLNLYIDHLSTIVNEQMLEYGSQPPTG